MKLKLACLFVVVLLAFIVASARAESESAEPAALPAGGNGESESESGAASTKKERTKPMTRDWVNSGDEGKSMIREWTPIDSPAKPLIKEWAPTDSDASARLTEFHGRGVSARYPVDWVVVGNLPENRLFHVKTMGGRVNASLTVQEVSPGTTLEQYRDATIADAEKDAAKLSPRKLSVESTKLGELPAYKLVFAITVPETYPAETAKQTLFVAISGNRGYLLCCTAFDALPSTYDAVFRNIADSVKVSAAKAPGAAKEMQAPTSI
jgi:hypothetical protein